MSTSIIENRPPLCACLFRDYEGRNSYPDHHHSVPVAYCTNCRTFSPRSLFLTPDRWGRGLRGLLLVLKHTLMTCKFNFRKNNKGCSPSYQPLAINTYSPRILFLSFFPHYCTHSFYNTLYIVSRWPGSITFSINFDTTDAKPVSGSEIISTKTAGEYLAAAILIGGTTSG